MSAPASAVALVIVTHETRDEVLGCLASVGPDEVDETVVVDAGSTDDTVDVVASRHPGVRIVALDNVGFGRAVNAGVRVTTAGTLVIANADVRFAPGAIVRLAEGIAASSDLGALGPLVRYPDGSIQASARRRPGPVTALVHAALGWVWSGNPATRRYRALDLDPHVARDVDILSGCALALRRRAFEDVGGFDPAYRLYVEDVDLSDRLRAAGWRLATEPRAEVVHRVGASTSSHPWRSRLQHARSIDLYLSRRSRVLRLVVRPAVVVVLAAWVVLSGTSVALRAGRVSTTGERRRTRDVPEDVRHD